MTRVQGGLTGDVREMAGIENRLEATLNRTAEELAHSECFDAEQRAEVYTILDALQSDTKVHRKTIKFLTTKLSKGGADA